MVCQKCGKEISDNISVCPYCGAMSGKAPDNAVPKKKLKKAAVIIGSLAVVIAAAIAVICITVPNMEIQVELTEDYSDIECGFSFKRPSDWQVSTSDSELILLQAPDKAAEIKVAEYSPDDFDLFTASSDEAKALFSEPDAFVDLSDAFLGDTPARLLVYQTKNENQQKRFVKNFCYEAGYNKYIVTCSYDAPYENAVNEIMASFTTDSAAPANTIAPNEIIYSKIPMNRLMEYSPSEIKKVLGEPLKSSKSFMLYENVAFFFEKDSNIIEGIHINETKELSIHGYPGTTLEELSSFNSESSDKSNILKNELGVEPIAYSYQQGMYNLEYDLPEYTMFTVFGEYGASPCSAWFINTNSVPNNQLCYNGISTSTLFELSYDDVLNIYGEPSINPYASPETYGGEGYLYETLCFPPENITYTFNRENGKVAVIDGLCDDFITVNGSKLSEKPDEFSRVLGEPVVSNSYDGFTASLYTLSEYTMDIISGSEGESLSIKLKSTENRIPYNIDTLASLILCNQEDVLLALGAPKHENPVRGYEIYGIWEYYVYNDELEVDFKVDDLINAYEIAFLPQCVEKKGKTLDKNNDDLQRILGTPEREGYYPDGYYYVDYTLPEYGLGEYEMVLHLEMPDYNREASLGYLYMYREEDYYTEPEPEPEPEVSSSSYTADGYTIVLGSMVYAKEGLFGLNYAEGYVQSIDGDTATVAWKYIYVNGLWAYSKYELYSTNEIFIGNTYDYYNSNGEKMSTVGIKNKTPISELYAQIPSGETVFNGIALEY